MHLDEQRAGLVAPGPRRSAVPTLRWKPVKTLTAGKATTMEILGIGTDIIECPRIGKMIEHHGELFLRRIYSEREIRYCQARKHAIDHFAGRWAAKEAILKAMGTGRSHGIAWTNIEVRNGQGGQPRVLVCGAAREVTKERGIADILVSISHCRTYATAYAMALGQQGAAAKPPDPAHPE